jgi:hypothetical protein
MDVNIDLRVAPYRGFMNAFLANLAVVFATAYIEPIDHISLEYSLEKAALNPDLTGRDVIDVFVEYKTIRSGNFSD